MSETAVPIRARLGARGKKITAQRTAQGGRITAPQWAILACVVAQAVFTGSSKEITTGKLVYSSMLLLVVVVWTIPVLEDIGKWKKQPLIRWLLLVFLV